MKNKLCYYLILFLPGLIGIPSGCRKENLSIPIVTTSVVTEISDTAAICGGTIISDGGSPIIERGLYEFYRNIYYPDKKPYNSENFTMLITGLQEDHAYELYAYAKNQSGLALGKKISFLTLIKPICGVSGVSKNSITLHGYVGQRPIHEASTPATAVFEYGISTSYGEEIAAKPSQLTGGLYVYGNTFDATLNGLTPNTKYHYRIKASNSEVTLYSTDYTFRTLNNLTVTDIEGNVYNTVTIGSQIWMTENLRATKYNDGTPIPLITRDEAWKFIKTPAYCWYNNDETNYKNIFGALYSSYTLTNGNLCPSGWHIPTKAEWETLEGYLGGAEIASYELKDFKWRGSNSSCFSAQMSGERHYYDGSFMFGDEQQGKLWLDTEYDQNNRRSVEFMWKTTDTWVTYGHKSSGRSIRCIKD